MATKFEAGGLGLSGRATKKIPFFCGSPYTFWIRLLIFNQFIWYRVIIYSFGRALFFHVKNNVNNLTLYIVLVVMYGMSYNNLTKRDIRISTSHSAHIVLNNLCYSIGLKHLFRLTPVKIRIFFLAMDSVLPTNMIDLSITLQLLQLLNH